jgi:hypothetical protein
MHPFSVSGRIFAAQTPMKGDHTMLLRTGIFVLLLVAADLLQAAPDAIVEGIQLPA